MVTDDPSQNYTLLPQILNVVDAQGMLDVNELRDKCFTRCFKSKMGEDNLKMTIDKFATADDDTWGEVLSMLNVEKNTKGTTSIARVQKERLILDYLTNLVGYKVNLCDDKGDGYVQEQELQAVYRELVNILFQNQKYEPSPEEINEMEIVGKLIKIIRTHSELDNLINILDITEGVVIPDVNSPLVQELGTKASEDCKIDFSVYIPKTCEELMYRIYKKVFKGIFDFYEESMPKAEVIMYDYMNRYTEKGMKIGIGTKYINTIYLPTHAQSRITSNMNKTFTPYKNIVSEDNILPLVALIRGFSKKKLATMDEPIIRGIINE